MIYIYDKITWSVKSLINDSFLREIKFAAIINRLCIFNLKITFNINYSTIIRPDIVVKLEFLVFLTNIQ